MPYLTIFFEKKTIRFLLKNCFTKITNQMSIQKKFDPPTHSFKVTFTLPKQAANGNSDVRLIGDFNNWDKATAIPMKHKNGGYTATLDLAAGREYEFRYLIDGEIWENDWAADKYAPTPFGVENSVVDVCV